MADNHNSIQLASLTALLLICIHGELAVAENSDAPSVCTKVKCCAANICSMVSCARKEERGYCKTKAPVVTDFGLRWGEKADSSWPQFQSIFCVASTDLKQWGTNL